MFVLFAAAAIYGLTVFGLYWFQDDLIFPRRVAMTPVLSLPPGNERIDLVTPTGEMLVGNLVPASAPSRGLLLGFGGNAWNADDCTVFLANRLHDLDIVVFHYRGYAPSEGRPSEEALFADALLIHDQLVERLRPARVVAIGFSLGSGVAAYLAAQRRLQGLILVTPFDSILAIAAARYPWVPVRSLLRHPFRTDYHLSDLDVPAAVIVASDDAVVPKARSDALVSRLRRPVAEETVPGSTHNGIYDVAAMDEALHRSLQAVMSAR